MPNLVSLVEYEGTAYHGFQIQPNLPTIQGELEKVLKKVLQEDIRVVGAGRTDAGVHATGQVISFETASKMPVEKIGKALNSLLPRDITVKNLRVASPDFHARFSAKIRHYSYMIFNREEPSPFFKNFVYHLPGSLDVGKMAEACQFFIGAHDFSAFSGDKERQPRRTVYDAGVSRNGDFIFIRFSAESFLRQMVRRMVGILVEVGRGEKSPEFVGEMLSARDPMLGVRVVPASGLCLTRVSY